MAIDPKLIILKPASELPTVESPTTGDILYYDGTGDLKKTPVAEFFQMLNTFAKPISTADATPTLVGWYKPTAPGTYANAGGLVSTEGNDTLFYFDGTTWVKTEVAVGVSESYVNDQVSQVHPMFLSANSVNLNAYLEIKLLEGDESISEKDLYIVFQRFITKDSSVNTIFQIGEKVGSSVGANLNLISSYAGPIDADSNGTIYFETVPENNSGARFSIIINVNRLVTGVDTNVDLTDRIRLNTVYFNSELKQAHKFPIFSKVKTAIDKNFIIDIKARNSSIEDFKNSDGSWKELFITFMRFKTFDATSTSIITVTQKVSGLVEFGVNDVATNSLDLSPDDNGIISLSLLPLNNSNIYLDVLVDVNKLKSGIDTQTVFTDQIQINTQYLVNQIKTKTVTRELVCFGDSVTEFKNYPELVGRKLGLKAYNVGIGGTTLGKNNSVYYTAINFPNLTEAIVSNDWAAVDAAVLYIKDNESDDNTPIITRLKSINFNNITDITVFYGTNDFTGGNNIGSISLTNEDILTTVGGLNKGIKTLLTAFPHLNIYIITPYHRFIDSGLTQDSDLVPNSAGKYLIEYVDAIKQISALNHLPCFDFYRNGQFSKYNHSIYFDDGVHQNDLGNEVIVNEISSFIEGNYSNSAGIGGSDSVKVFENALYLKAGSNISDIVLDPVWPAVGLFIDSNGLTLQEKGVVLNIQTNLNKRFIELSVKLNSNSIFYVGTKNAEVSVGENVGFVNCSTGKLIINDLFSSGSIEKNIPFPIVTGREYIVRFYKIDDVTKLELIDTITSESVDVQISQLGHFDKYKFGVDNASTITIKSIGIFSINKERPFIGFYGDSNTEGNNVSDSTKSPYYKDRFTNLIGDKLGKEYYVSARSGGNIDGVLSRIKIELPVMKPEYAFVTIGTNGGNTEGKLNELADYCQLQGVKLILNSIPITDSNSVATNTMIQNIVSQRGLMSVRTDIATSVNNDGITQNTSLFLLQNSTYLHLNVAGNLAIYNRSLVDIAKVFNEAGSELVRHSQASVHEKHIINVLENGVKNDGITDNTSIINSLIVKLISIGGGALYFPSGEYLVTQIEIPDVQFWCNIELVGEFIPAQRFGTITVPGVYDPDVTKPNGAVIKSDSVGSGIIWCKSGSSYDNFNMGMLTVRNLTLRAYENPNICGIDAWAMFQLYVENVIIDTRVYNVNAIEPTYDKSGIVTPKNSNCALTYIKNVSISGFMHGIKVYEHTNGDSLQIQSCKNALSFYFASHSSYFARCCFQRNTVQVNVVEEHIFAIAQLNMEYAGNGQTTPNNAWQATQYELKDPDNKGIANIYYANVKGALGAVSTFRMIGASNIVVKRFGSETRVTTTIPSP